MISQCKTFAETKLGQRHVLCHRKNCSGGTLMARKYIKRLLIISVGFIGLGFGLAQGTPLSTSQELSGEVSAAVTDWINKGKVYLSGGQFEAARESFEEAIALNYKSSEAHFGLGLAEYERGDYPAALFAFSEVARLYPEFFDGHFNKAITLSKLRRFDEAAETFATAIEEADPEASDEQKIDAYLGYAGMLKRIERFADAAEAYNNALELRPGDTELAYRKGEALYLDGNGLEGLADLIELETQTSDYRVSALISDIYIQNEQTDYALHALERSLRKAQGAADSKAESFLSMKLGLLQTSLGQDEEAMASFGRAAAADPSSWEAHYHYGISFLALGQPESALGSLQQAQALNPDSPEVNLALASTYDAVGMTNEAAQISQIIVDLLDSDELSALEQDELATAKFFLAKADFMQGDFETAMDKFEDVIAAKPDDSIAYTWAGLAAYNLEKYQTAIKFNEAAVAIDPKNIEAKVNLGSSYYKATDYRNAAIIYELLTEENPNDAESFYNLGLSLLAQNKPEQAKEALTKASELGFTAASQTLAQYF